MNPKDFWRRLLGLSVLLFLLMFAALFLGTAAVDLAGLLAGSKIMWSILLEVRLPRILLAALVGFGLSLGGVVFQAILRNPLADPFVLGLSSGSALGAVLGILFAETALPLPLFSFGGALGSLLLLFSIAGRRAFLDRHTLLLSGVILNTLFSALILFLLSLAAPDQHYALFAWLYGDLSQATYGQVALTAPWVLLASAGIYALARPLNLLTLGADMAMRLGLAVVRTQLILILLSALLVGLVVAFSGLIGFVGLLAPHLARMAFGPDHRLLLPAAALGGALFLVLADTLARSLLAPQELPVGVLSAGFGAPFFLYLLKRQGSQWQPS